MSQAANDKLPQSFEAALAELESIVQGMETGKLSLEESLDFLADDELLEVTPKAYRLRKRLLSADDRAKERKRAQMQPN